MEIVELTLVLWYLNCIQNINHLGLIYFAVTSFNVIQFNKLFFFFNCIYLFFKNLWFGVLDLGQAKVFEKGTGQDHIYIYVQIHN